MENFRDDYSSKAVKLNNSWVRFTIALAICLIGVIVFSAFLLIKYGCQC